MNSLVEYIEKIQNLSEYELAETLRFNGYSRYSNFIEEHQITGSRFLKLDMQSLKQNLTINQAYELSALVKSINRYPFRFKFPSELTENNLKNDSPSIDLQHESKHISRDTAKPEFQKVSKEFLVDLNESVLETQKRPGTLKNEEFLKDPNTTDSNRSDDHPKIKDTFTERKFKNRPLPPTPIETQKTLPIYQNTKGLVHDNCVEITEDREEGVEIQETKTIYANFCTEKAKSHNIRNVSRREASSLLENSSDGTYLIRPSQKSDYEFTISIMFKGKMYNVGIERGLNGSLKCSSTLTQPTFSNILKLIDHYQINPLYLQDDNNCMQSIYLQNVLTQND